MLVKYKYAEPTIIIQPHIYGMFDYISKNVKTNLIWVCLVRKLGSKYIIEDLYFPPQNVNGFYMCNFDEDFITNVTASTFNNDYRPCRFNMIGKFTMEKTVAITDSVIKDFEKIMHPSLDECLMMQLNQHMEMEFAINRKATILTDIAYNLDMSSIIDTGALKQLLESKVGHYVVKTTTTEYKPTQFEKAEVSEGLKHEPISLLLRENLNWVSIL